MILGFSTGSLAKGNFVEALRMLEHLPNTPAIELSALREAELPILVAALPGLALKRYKHVSLHAPSKLVAYTENQVVDLLLQVAQLKIPVIVHPDIITDFNLWRQLGSFLVIENMDKRKAVGRTTEDLERLFSLLPDARFCLDLAHAKQVDPYMVECAKMLRQFRGRLLQFHISDVSSDSNHVAINGEAIRAFRKVQTLIPPNIPFIIESPVMEVYVTKELRFVNSIFHVHNEHSKPHSHHPFVNDDAKLMKKR